MCRLHSSRSGLAAGQSGSCRHSYAFTVNELMLCCHFWPGSGLERGTRGAAVSEIDSGGEAVASGIVWPDAKADDAACDVCVCV